MSGQVDMIFLHFLFELFQGNTTIVVSVHSFKEIHQLIALDVGIDIFKKFRKFLESQIMFGFISQGGKQFSQINVLFIDLESQVRHYSFEFVFELLILFGILLEITSKDFMEEQLIPGKSFFLIFLETFREKVFGALL